MHLNDGQLRAHLDGELDPAGRQHLAGCRACQARQAELEAQSGRVRRRLEQLAPTQISSEAAARQALADFKTWSAQRARTGKDFSMLSQLFARRLRPVWIAAALVVLAGFSLAFAPVRAWAAEFLGLFRVQQVAILPVDTTRLSDLAGDETLGQEIGQLFSDSVTIVKEPGDPVEVADGAAAGELAGFAVRLPDAAGQPALITVQDGTAFEFVVNRESAQMLLDQMGHGDLRLPPSLHGATVSVVIPMGVSAAYGNCPAPYAEGGHGPRAFRSCVMLAQIPSPTVTAPPDLDVQALALIGLQVMGMTAEEAQAFSQTVDWTSTLVIPIPRSGHSYEQVPVDGVTGNLIVRHGDDGVPARYGLVWVKNGIIYGLIGFDDPAAGLELANSLR